MIRQENHDSAKWKPLPPGSLTAFAKRARSKRRRKQFTRATVPGAAVIILLLLVPQLSNSPQQTQPRFDGVTCNEVASHVESFMAKELEPKWIAAIEIHLNQCPTCRQRIESMRGAKSLASQNQKPETLVEGSLPHSQFLAVFIK